jgi:hypothetical protein
VSRDLVELFHGESASCKASVRTTQQGMYQGRPQRGGLQPGTQPPSQSKFKRNTNFVNTVISVVLRDFPSSRNQPLKWADDYYIGILKNRMKSIKVS